MHHSDYVPLHVHTEYSLLDGAVRIGELIDTAVKYRMPACAMTDHGNMFGAIEFYTKATKAGLRPIMGCEVYVAPDSRHERNDRKPYHLVLLARDNEGYKNLLALVSKAYIEGLHGRPRVDKELLAMHGKGLIGLSACLKGEVPSLLTGRDAVAARKAALEYVNFFGEGNFYLEIQDNGIEEQIEVNRGLIAMSKDLGLGLVATNDCHYLLESDRKAHEVLLCIQTGKTMSDPRRFRFNGGGYHFRTPEEMAAAFSEVPEAIKNTRLIAERCNVELTLGEFMLPKVKLDGQRRPSEALDEYARIGLRNRMGDNPPEEYVARLARELDVIKKMKYASYFLIVSDFISHAKQSGVPVGPGRGSAAGSLVAYSLGITEIDPIKYGLLFERFLNPERISMPDIDVDFCKDKRQSVIEYVTGKYGADHVAQIITFGTMAAKAAIRDVARAMDFPYSEADKLSKLVPETLKITLKDALKEEPQLKTLYDTDERVKELIDVAMRLEGMARHASTHAAGVVISPVALMDVVPLYRTADEEAVVTQFEMESVEKAGLIKFDFLGLKTLTVIEKCMDLLKLSGIDFAMDAMPLDDRRTFEFLGTGQSTGVFQLESEGMKDILTRMKPNRFEDLIALVALYRPGPIKSGMVDDYILRKKGEREIKYEFNEIKDILDETYGVILYQEQVMSIANRLSGFTLGQADTLRKAMGKKKADVMEQQKDFFVSGAVKNGHNGKKAAELFEKIAKFAEYGFNKSHSAAYAYISYQTAYLKAHYPVHFMAATMSADIENSDKVVKSIKECRAMGIGILPPDINLCGSEFAVDGKNIRFGLGAVKGVGAAAVETILAAREAGQFASQDDYMSRVDGKKVNKKVNECLIKAGALDSVTAKGSDMAAHMLSLCTARAAAMEKLNSAGAGGAPSLSLFGPTDDEPSSSAAWEEADLLKHEKEALGFYITGNPLSRYGKLLETMELATVSALAEKEDGAEVEAAGIIMAIKKIKTKRGDAMAALSIEDEGGSVELVVFPDTYRDSLEIIVKDTPVLFKGKLEKSDKGLKVACADLMHMDSLMARKLEGRRAVIAVPEGTSDLKPLKALVSAHSGPVPLYLLVRSREAEVQIQTSMSVAPDNGLISGVEQFYGRGALRVI